MRKPLELKPRKSRRKMDNDNAVEKRKAKIQEQLINQLKRTPIIEVACNKVQIGRNSYYRWRREDNQFARQCDEAIEDGCSLVNDLAESTLINAMKEQNLTACMYWLNHRHNTYRNKVELSGNLEIKKDELTKEQEEGIRKALKLASIITNENGGKNGK